MDNLPEPSAPVVTQIPTVQWTKTARYIAAVLFIIALLGLAVFISPIARNLVAALLFAFILDIPIRFIARRTRLPYGSSIMLVYLPVYILMAVLLIFGWRYLVDYLQGVIADLSTSGASLLSTLQAGAAGTGQGGRIIAGINTQTLAQPLKALLSLLLGILGLPIRVYINLAVVIVNVGFFTFLSNLLVFSAYGARGSLKKWIPELFDREAALLLT